MGFFRWKDEFSVDNEELDQQHKIFLDTLNKIHSRIGAVDSPEVVKKSVVALGHYIDVHFIEEEEHLVSIGYPDIERQRRQHDFFRARISELESSCEDLSDTELEKLLVFMRDWFLKHVLEADQDYARYASADKMLYSA